jgi:hypothetical protein
MKIPATDKTRSIAEEIRRANGIDAAVGISRLGMEGAMEAARKMGKEMGGWIPVPGKGLENPHAFSGAGYVDVMAFTVEGILVIDGKGCGSPSDGTPEKLRERARRMARSRDGATRAAGKVLSRALRTGEPRVRYFEARTGMESGTGVREIHLP